MTWPAGGVAATVRGPYGGGPELQRAGSAEGAPGLWVGGRPGGGRH